MAASAKIDLYGSTQTNGISSNRLDRAVRRAFVKGTGTTNAGLQEAADAILDSSANVLFHQNITNLPLAAITTTRFSPTKVMAYLEYRRSIVTVPTQPAYLLGKFRCDHREPTIWVQRPSDFTAHRPSGFITYENPPADGDPNKSPTSRPKDWIWMRPALSVYIPTVLGFNPLPNVGQLLDHVNSDSVTAFGGFTFVAGEILFDGVDVDAYEVVVNGISTVKFKVGYSFKCVQGGFVQQDKRWNPAAVGPPASDGHWDFPISTMFEIASFTGQFPVHA